MANPGDVRRTEPEELRKALLSCLGVERFADGVVAEAPFDSNDELLAAADRAAGSLRAREVEAALAHHPRIGERMAGTGRTQAFSASEQSAAEASDESLAAAVAAGNRAYEARFDRVFLIRAAGRGRAEILAELTRRLELDDDAELATVAAELHDITMLRLATLFPPAAASVAPAAGAASAVPAAPPAGSALLAASPAASAMPAASPAAPDAPASAVPAPTTEETP